MDYNKLNRYQTTITDELKQSLPREVYAELLDIIDTIPFVNWLVQPEEIRGFAKDRPRHKDLDDSDDRKQYDDDRIVVDITKPHILEDMDFFRERAIFFDKYGTYTDLTPNPNPNGEYALFWKEELRRWKDGLIRPSDGEWIPGGLYFYWNYSPIWLVEEETISVKGKTKTRGKRVRKFPKPWLGDYLFYHYMEQGRENGQHGKLLKARGLGFEQPHSETVLTPTGIKTIGDIKEGDYLIGIDGKPTKVLEVYKQGLKDVYKVTLLDGRSVKCGLNHLWYVKDLTKRKIRPVKLSEMLDKGLTWTINGGKNVAYKYKIPKLSPVEYSEKEYSIPPYVLGALLGDGTLNRTSIKIATDDIEVVEEFERLLPEYKLIRDNSNNNYIISDSRRFEDNEYNKDYVNSKYGVNKLKRDIENLGLNVKCFDKFIPEEYLFGSIEQRMELLKGLMDSDGSVNSEGNCEFANSNLKLITQVATLCRSLGIKARMGLGRAPRKKEINGKTCNIQQEYRLYLSTNEVIFKIPRKVNRCRVKSTFDDYPIVNIEKLDYQEESSCFLVDNDTHTYLTGDYVPTHNSFKMGSLSPRNMYVYQGSGNPNFHLASDKTFLSGDKGVFGKVVDVLDWIADYTPLPKLRLTNSIKSMEIQLGYQDEYGVRRGPQSSVYGISLKDNPDKARGIRGPLIHYEEDGLFPNLEDSWNINRKATEDGDVAFGYQLAGGTGGTEGASFEGSEKLFYNPNVYNIYGVHNVYDRNVDSSVKCGFFWGAYLNRNKCYDLKEGEPDVVKALIEILNDRHRVKYHSTDPRAITQKKAEEPITPQEAIMRREGNIFPAEDIKNYLAEIMPNFQTFVSSHYVGKLVINTAGEVEWKLSDGNLFPIRDFPFLDGNKEGAVEIYEMPKRFGDGTIPNGRYIGGCLIPGEKVLTSTGLMDVDKVTFEDKLINENGKIVPIKTIYKLYKENEDIYTIKMSNSFRTTTFTKEHPILSCTPKMKYHNASTCKKLNINQRERIYNFEYKTVDKLNIGDYVKIPNIYLHENMDISGYWTNNSRVDRNIDNPLFTKDFWWFIGLWLGDGYSLNSNNVIAFNIKETDYITRCENLIFEIFDRKPSKRVRNNSVEISFSNKELSQFLHKNFGRYADGKNIPEWVKYISKDLKTELISGYLASDGCIYTGKNGKTCEFVSINLEMLEGFQDILFSLGLISSLQKLRNEGKHLINSKICNTKVTYSLRIGHSDTLRLGNLINWYSSHKLSQLVGVNEKEYKNKTTLNCFFADDYKYIYVRVKNIIKNTYTGFVYNFECDTHTFMCRMITTHNCDPYDDDTGTSLGSIIVFDRWSRTIVAEYTGRPRFADEFYEICFRLGKFYNASLMYENNKKGLFAYFRNKNILYMLAQTPKILIDKQNIKPESLYGNKGYGFNATAEVNTFLRTAQVKWMCEPILGEDGETSGLLRLHKIRSIAYLKECASWNSDGNFDRVSAMSAVILYDLELGNVEIVKSTENIKTRANDPFFNKFYQTRSKMLNRW